MVCGFERKAMNQSLRQSGSRFATAVFGTPEGVPLSRTDRASRDAPACGSFVVRLGWSCGASDENAGGSSLRSE